jgi:uncharacterized protein (DUF1330 family)
MAGDQMSILIVAQLQFKDRERYNRYQAKFADVFRRFRGRLVAADEHPTVLEGQEGPDKIVILEFPDEVAALEFHSSAEYQEISIDRKAGADAGVFREELQNLRRDLDHSGPRSPRYA